jgi:hypothetical protein
MGAHTMYMVWVQGASPAPSIAASQEDIQVAPGATAGTSPGVADVDTPPEVEMTDVDAGD